MPQDTIKDGYYGTNVKIQKGTIIKTEPFKASSEGI
jgi:hypothetical protein